nr:Cid1/3 [Paramecium bursaria]
MQQVPLINIYEQYRIQQNQVDKIQRSMDDFIKLLKSIPFKQMNLCPLYYQYYGSFCNGFGLNTSDVDFTILTNSYVEESQLLRDISKILKNDENPRSRFIVKSEALKARIPNLSIEDKQEKIDIDLSINNLLGVINTKLLYNYSQLHPSIQQGGVLIKVWAKKWDLIQKNKFSSYALILMWIYFLQQKHNLPNLQDSMYQEGLDQESFKLKYKRKVFKSNTQHPETFVVNTFFLDDKQKQQQLMKNELDNIQLKDLLIQFWEFYGEYHMNDSIISIHSRLQKKRQHLFQIDDPFDLLHDPGKRSSELNQEDLDKFKLAAIFLSKNKIELFQNKNDQ